MTDITEDILGGKVVPAIGDYFFVKFDDDCKKLIFCNMDSTKKDGYIDLDGKIMAYLISIFAIEAKYVYMKIFFTNNNKYIQKYEECIIPVKYIGPSLFLFQCDDNDVITSKLPFIKKNNQRVFKVIITDNKNRTHPYNFFNPRLYKNKEQEEDSRGACFTLNTLRLIFSRFPKIYAITQSSRENKKIYRCNLENVGTLEFTDDHPFLYKKKIILYEELIYIHPNISNIIELQTNPDEIIYNVIFYTDHMHEKNMIVLDDDLRMIGGKFPYNVSQGYFEKKVGIINNLFLKHPECQLTDYCVPLVL